MQDNPLFQFLGGIADLFQPVAAGVGNTLSRFFSPTPSTPTPRPGYQFVPGTQIQAPVGSELLGSTPKPFEFGKGYQPSEAQIQEELKRRSSQNQQGQVRGMATPMPMSDIGKRIKTGLVDYGGEKLPALSYIPLFQKAAELYPLFQSNPYLLPQISILESSGGRNITRANNPLNWGARLQAEGLFNPASVEESIMKAITGIGERMPQYAPFRVNRPLTPEEIFQFAKVYEPANASYGNNLLEGIKRFETLGGSM